eukprot:IDg18049t1
MGSAEVTTALELGFKLHSESSGLRDTVEDSWFVHTIYDWLRVPTNVIKLIDSVAEGHADFCGKVPIGSNVMICAHAH